MEKKYKVTMLVNLWGKYYRDEDIPNESIIYNEGGKTSRDVLQCYKDSNGKYHSSYTVKYDTNDLSNSTDNVKNMTIYINGTARKVLNILELQKDIKHEAGLLPCVPDFEYSIRVEDSTGGSFVIGDSNIKKTAEVLSEMIDNMTPKKINNSESTPRFPHNEFHIEIDDYDSETEDYTLRLTNGAVFTLINCPTLTRFIFISTLMTPIEFIVLDNNIITLDNVEDIGEYFVYHHSKYLRINVPKDIAPVYIFNQDDLSILSCNSDYKKPGTIIERDVMLDEFGYTISYERDIEEQVGWLHINFPVEYAENMKLAIKNFPCMLSINGTETYVATMQGLIPIIETTTFTKDTNERYFRCANENGVIAEVPCTVGYVYDIDIFMNKAEIVRLSYGSIIDNANTIDYINSNLQKADISDDEIIDDILNNLSGEYPLDDEEIDIIKNDLHNNDNNKKESLYDTHLSHEERFDSFKTYIDTNKKRSRLPSPVSRTVMSDMTILSIGGKKNQTIQIFESDLISKVNKPYIHFITTDTLLINDDEQMFVTDSGLIEVLDEVVDSVDDVQYVIYYLANGDVIAHRHDASEYSKGSNIVGKIVLGNNVVLKCESYEALFNRVKNGITTVIQMPTIIRVDNKL